MEAGTRNFRPALVSLAWFTCSITCTGSRSRCWRLRRTARQGDWHEISIDAGGQHGHLYREEQDSSEAGMAAESCRGGGSEESVPHRTYANPVGEGGAQAASDD